MVQTVSLLRLCTGPKPDSGTSVSSDPDALRGDEMGMTAIGGGSAGQGDGFGGGAMLREPDDVRGHRGDLIERPALLSQILHLHVRLLVHHGERFLQRLWLGRSTRWRNHPLPGGMVDAGHKTPTSTADFSERRQRISPSAHTAWLTSMLGMAHVFLNRRFKMTAAVYNMIRVTTALDNTQDAIA
jgi:hypothetical protein